MSAHIHFYPHKGYICCGQTGGRKHIYTQGTGFLLPPRNQCQVKEAVVPGVDKMPGGLSFTEIDGSP